MCRIAFRLHWKFIETSLKTSLMIILKKWECGTNPTLSGNFCCPVRVPCYMEQEAWILNHVSRALILSSFFLGGILPWLQDYVGYFSDSLRQYYVKGSRTPFEDSISRYWINLKSFWYRDQLKIWIHWELNLGILAMK